MREMQPVGGTLQSLLQKLGLERQLRTYDALVHWSDIVGKQIAQVARPLRLDADTLWVAVKNHIWTQELNFHKGTILKRLNERVGEERFKAIRFVVRRSLPASPSLITQGVGEGESDSAHSQRELGVERLSESEIATIESCLASVSDPTLRDALKRAQIASLRYQKYLARLGWRRCIVCECYHCDDSAVCFLCAQGV